MSSYSFENPALVFIIKLCSEYRVLLGPTHLVWFDIDFLPSASVGLLQGLEQFQTLSIYALLLVF